MSDLVPEETGLFEEFYALTHADLGTQLRIGR